MYQTHLIPTFEQGLQQILSIARGGFQSHQDLLGSHPQFLKSRKEPVEPLNRIGKRGRFDKLTFLHCQARHCTRLHADIDPHYIGRHDRIGQRGGSRSRHHHCSLSLQLSSCSQLRTYRDFSTGRPSRQDERELIVDRQSSQRMPRAATSPMVASSPDGRGAVYSRRSLSVPNAPHVTTKALPLLPPVEQMAASSDALSYLPISI